MIKIQNSLGYTLIELLVVIGVFVAVGSIIGTILVSTLRGTNKTNNISVVNQNGNYALSQIARTIRFARSFDGVSTDTISGYTTNCYQSAVYYKNIRVKDFNGVQTTFSCEQQAVPVIVGIIATQSGSTNVTPLLDTTQVALSPNTCNFTCTQTNISDAPTIGISFTLTQKSTSNFVENTVQPILFQTSVVLRNLSQ